MPTLITKATGTVLDLGTAERLHWIIGRSEECDLVLPDFGISRFHATIFRTQERVFFIVDHSLNGTHICTAQEEPAENTRVPTVSPTDMSKLHGLKKSSSPSHDTHEFEIKELFLGDRQIVPQKEFDLHKSHAEFRAQELNSRLPPLIGYEPHGLAAGEDMQPLLKMIYSASEVNTLASMARPLAEDQYVVFIGSQQHFMVFKE